MTYNKPEINVLGDAATVIQSTGLKVVSQTFDNGIRGSIQPAYDLDE